MSKVYHSVYNTLTCTIFTCTYMYMYIHAYPYVFFSFPRRGDAEIIQRDGVVGLPWRDNRVVSLLSTNAQPQQQDLVQRHEHDGRRVYVPCPAAMALYNAYMVGVDRNDQLRQYYHVRLKWQKMYRYLFWFIFEVVTANAHILFTHYSGAVRKPLKEFRLELAKDLVGDYSSKKLLTPPVTLPLRHFPSEANCCRQPRVTASLLVLPKQPTASPTERHAVVLSGV